MAVRWISRDGSRFWEMWRVCQSFQAPRPHLFLTLTPPVQIRMEYLIMSNLDAAIKDEPKPALFGPTAGQSVGVGGGLAACGSEAAWLRIPPAWLLAIHTCVDPSACLLPLSPSVRSHRPYSLAPPPARAPAGTVACPSCRGTPVYHSFTPNMARMFRAEPPFWLRTLTRMGELGTLDVSAAAHRRRQPAAAASTSDAASCSPSRGGGSVVAEVPNHPFGDVRIQAALDSAGDLGGYQPRSVATASDQDYGPRDPLGFAATSSSDGTFSVPPVSLFGGSFTSPKLASGSPLAHGL